MGRLDHWCHWCSQAQKVFLRHPSHSRRTEVRKRHLAQTNGFRRNFPTAHQNETVCFHVFSILKTSFLTFLSQSQDTFGHIWIHLGDVWCILLAKTRNHFHYGVRWCSRQDHETSREVAQQSVPWGILGEGNSWTPVATHLMSMLVKDGERTSEWSFLFHEDAIRNQKTFSKLGDTWCSFVGLAQIQWIYPIGGVAPLWGWDKISHSHVPIQDELLHHFESFGSWSQPLWLSVSWVSDLNSESCRLSPHAITRFTLCNTF